MDISIALKNGMPPSDEDISRSSKGLLIILLAVDEICFCRSYTVI